MKESGQTSKPTCIGCSASRYMLIAIIGSYLVMYVISIFRDDTTQSTAPAGMMLVESDEALASGAFFLDRREVTNAEFAEFVSETGYTTQAEESGADQNWRRPQGVSSATKSESDKPVVALSREDAEAYARWTGKRLLSGEEMRYVQSKGLIADGSSVLYAESSSTNSLSSSGFRCASDVTLTSH